MTGRNRPGLRAAIRRFENRAEPGYSQSATKAELMAAAIRSIPKACAAKFEGTCPICAAHVHKGDIVRPVEELDPTGWAHHECWPAGPTSLSVAIGRAKRQTARMT